MSEVNILGVTVKSCGKAIVKLPVAALASGIDLSIAVHIYNGANPGPVIALMSSSHGDEIFSIELIRRILEEVDLEKLSGTILAVPAMNPLGVEAGTRNTLHDGFNMNRVFPGNKGGWVTEKMANALVPVCQAADLMIDWHCGLYNAALNYIYVKQAENELGLMVEELSRVYGVEYIYKGAPGFPGSICNYMASMGKVCLMPEIGGGLDLPDYVMEEGIRGAFNVMKRVGMYPGDITVYKTQYVITKRPIVRSVNGGLFYPQHGVADSVNGIYQKGTVLALIRNPQTLEIIEEIKAPCEQSVLLQFRSFFSKVHPGDYAYIIGEMEGAQVIEN